MIVFFQTLTIECIMTYKRTTAERNASQGKLKIPHDGANEECYQVPSRGAGGAAATSQNLINQLFMQTMAARMIPGVRSQIATACKPGTQF